jgi:hypothetical protein
VKLQGGGGGYKAGSLGDGLDICEEVQLRLEESALLIFNGKNYHARSLTITDLARW